VSGALSSPITSKLRVKIQLELASLVWLAGESFRAVDILGEAVRYALENRIDFYHLFSRSYCFGNFCDFNAIDSYLIPLKEQCRTFPPGSTQYAETLYLTVCTFHDMVCCKKVVPLGLLNDTRVVASALTNGTPQITEDTVNRLVQLSKYGQSSEEWQLEQAKVALATAADIASSCTLPIELYQQIIKLLKARL